MAGIGDMSGDVFGNGMLQSRHIRLVAAFDHRHIFLDPDPDPEASFAERQRLFGLARSSWADYEPSADLSRRRRLLPHARSRCRCRREVQLALGVDGDLHDARRAGIPRAAGPRRPAVERRHRHLREGERRSPTPTSATRPTTPCGSTPTSCAAGSSARAATSASPSAGASSTPLAGGRINTDAIDNSAGVDCSDHEVNIKILLDAIVADGRPHRASSATRCWRDDRRGRRPGPAGQLPAEPGASATDWPRRPAWSTSTPATCGLWSRPASSTDASSSSPARRSSTSARPPARASPAPSSPCSSPTARSRCRTTSSRSDLPEDPYLASELERYFPAADAAAVRRADPRPSRCAGRSSPRPWPTTSSTGEAHRWSSAWRRRREPPRPTSPVPTPPPARSSASPTSGTEWRPSTTGLRPTSRRPCCSRPAS